MLLFAPVHSNVPGSTGFFASSCMSSADSLGDSLNPKEAQRNWLTLVVYLKFFLKHGLF